MKQVILVKFKDDLNLKDFAYFTDIALKEDDLVVVPTGGSYANFGFGVAKVVQVEGILPTQAKRATKWVLNKVDVEAFNKRLEAEKMLQEKLNQLRSRRSQLEEMVVLKMLAEQDPETAKLLTELAELDPSMESIVSNPKLVGEAGNLAKPEVKKPAYAEPLKMPEVF